MSFGAEPPRPAAVCEGGDLDCGNGLLLIIRKAMDPLHPGQVLEVRSREPSVGGDLPAWCRMVRHEFLGSVKNDDDTSYFIRKGGAADSRFAPAHSPGAGPADSQPAASEATALRREDADDERSRAPVGSDPEGGASESTVGGSVENTLEGTLEDTLEEDLDKARNFTWRVRVRAADKGRSRVYARSQSFDVGQPIDFDFSKPDEPLSAVEHLLASLAACLTGGYQIHASRRGVVIYQAELSLQGRLNNPLVYLGLEEDGHPGLASVRGTFYVNADADDDVLAELWETTLARSPVAATLRPAVELDLRLSVVL